MLHPLPKVKVPILIKYTKISRAIFHRGDLLLPPLMTAFYQQFPHCEVHTMEMSTVQLRVMLEAKELDFIVDIPHPDTVTYCNEFLLDESILLAVPRSDYQSAPLKAMLDLFRQQLPVLYGLSSET